MMVNFCDRHRYSFHLFINDIKIELSCMQKLFEMIWYGTSTFIRFLQKIFWNTTEKGNNISRIIIVIRRYFKLFDAILGL